MSGRQYYRIQDEVISLGRREQEWIRQGREQESRREHDRRRQDQEEERRRQNRQEETRESWAGGADFGRTWPGPPQNTNTPSWSPDRRIPPPDVPPRNNIPRPQTPVSTYLASAGQHRRHDYYGQHSRREQRGRERSRSPSRRERERDWQTVGRGGTCGRADQHGVSQQPAVSGLQPGRRTDRRWRSATSIAREARMRQRSDFEQGVPGWDRDRREEDGTRQRDTSDRRDSRGRRPSNYRA
jgi:hypothetical protein